MSTTQPPSEVWNRIAAHLDDPGEVVALVRDLDGPGRREVARNLPAALKAAVEEPLLSLTHEERAAFRAAGAATLGGSAAVASWLSLRELNPRWGDLDDTDVLLDLWEGRDASWLADLALRLALRQRGPRCIGRGLALRLLTETGVEPPEHDPLVAAWVLNGPPRAEDPLLPALLPRVFDAAGVSGALSENPSWMPALARLASRGEVDPAMLLDGCVRRFLGGGTTVNLHPFVQLHLQLEPAGRGPRTQMTRRYVRDHMRLIQDVPGPVSGLSARLLRELPDLEPELLTAALDALLARPEPALVQEGLAWMEEVVRRSPEFAGERAAAALAGTFGHASVTVQRQAARLALELPETTPPEAIRAAVPLLPHRLAVGVAARFGGHVEHDDPAPPLLTAPATPPPGPYPSLTTPAKVAAAIAGLAWDWDGIESIMEALVRLAHRDRHALRAALARENLGDTSIPCYVGSPNHWLRAIACVLVDGAPVEGEPHGGWDFTPADGTPSPLQLLLRDRCEDLLVAVLDDALPPVLLATPTASTGHVAPMALVERLEAYESAGADPSAADFQQAVLRLPREVDPAAVRRAAALTSPAGRDAASWLARGGAPAAEVEVTVPEDSVPSAAVQAPETGLPHVDAVLSCPVDSRSPYVRLWAEMLPSHPEVADAYLLPHLGDPYAHLGELTLQMRGDGLFGEAVARTLAAGLGVRANGPASGWLAALAARGDLPAAAFGRWTGLLVRSGEIKLIRTVEELESAASAGAYPQVWTAIAAALPALCPAPGERAPFALDRLIALGTRTARWSSARGAIPEIAALAARKGTSNLCREARTLHTHLTSSPT